MLHILPVQESPINLGKNETLSFAPIVGFIQQASHDYISKRPTSPKSSQAQFAWVDRRLRQGTAVDEPFGRISVIMTGDLGQLQPVG